MNYITDLLIDLGYTLEDCFDREDSDAKYTVSIPHVEGLVSEIDKQIYFISERLTRHPFDIAVWVKTQAQLTLLRALRNAAYDAVDTIEDYLEDRDDA